MGGFVTGLVLGFLLGGAAVLALVAWASLETAFPAAAAPAAADQEIARVR